jgi:hypothetical protein
MVEMTTLTFDEQLEAMMKHGLVADAESLRASLESARPSESLPRSILAPSRRLAPIADSAARIQRRGKAVVLGHLEAHDLNTFVPIEAVELPDQPAYLAVDVDLGGSSRNIPPEDALREILDAGRSPLTLDEGVALMLQQPEVIAPNWGFSMAGSRRDDQRVTAFWISEGRPKLGWCWDRNPHTWLGTASCAGRTAGAGSSSSGPI